MKKLACVFAILTLVSCGQASVEFVSTTKTAWGTIGLAEGWVVTTQTQELVKMESQLERNTEIIIRKVRLPQDIDGYAKSFIEASGRTLDKSGTIEIDGKHYSCYWMSAVIGADKVSELLALIPQDKQLLAIDAMWITKSVLAGIPEGMVKSIKLGGK